MNNLVLTPFMLEDTLNRLRSGGKLGHERVVLWLASAAGGASNKVCEVYEPKQDAARDYFHLPAVSLKALMSRLRADRLKVAAQIHTHPQEAFHSQADARWAIVRHIGALSLVLPRFAVATSLANFFDEVKIYELQATGEWCLTPNHGPSARVEVRS